MAADFSHDDLMFATRLARMGGGRDRRGLDLLAAMSGGGGGNRGDQTDALVGALVQSALAERQARVEAGLRRAAADSDWEKRRAAAVEDRDAGSARFFAELGARKSEREGDRTFQSTEAERADTRRAKASAADFERANQAADARADRQAYDRVIEQIAVMEQQGFDPPDVLLRHRDELGGRLKLGQATSQPVGATGGGSGPRPGSPAAIRRAADRARAMEPLQEGLAAIQQGVRSDFHADADVGARARRPGHLVKLQQVATQLAAVDPEGVGPALQPIVDDLLSQYESGNRGDGELLDAINRIKKLQGYEPWNPTDFDTEWKKAHPPLRGKVMPGLSP